MERHDAEQSRIKLDGTEMPEAPEAPDAPEAPAAAKGALLRAAEAARAMAARARTFSEKESVRTGMKMIGTACSETAFMMLALAGVLALAAGGLAVGAAVVLIWLAACLCVGAVRGFRALKGMPSSGWHALASVVVVSFALQGVCALGDGWADMKRENAMLRAMAAAGAGQAPAPLAAEASAGEASAFAQDFRGAQDRVPAAAMRPAIARIGIPMAMAAALPKPRAAQAKAQEEPKISVRKGRHPDDPEIAALLDLRMPAARKLDSKVRLEDHLAADAAGPKKAPKEDAKKEAGKNAGKAAGRDSGRNAKTGAGKDGKPGAGKEAGAAKGSGKVSKETAGRSGKIQKKESGREKSGRAERASAGGRGGRTARG